MIIPRLIWTLLPNGRTRDAYQFSMFVSPRLETAGTVLGDYEPTNWPAAIQNMALAETFWVQIDNAASPLVPATIATKPLRPDLWAKLLPPSTLVKPHVFQDNTIRPVFSYSIAPIEAYLELLYAAVSNLSASEFPNLKGPGRLRELVDEFRRALPVMRRGLDNRQVSPGAHPQQSIETELASFGSTLPLVEIYRAMRFYRRGNQENWAALGYNSQSDPVLTALIPEPPPVHEFDFHEAIALLGDHPFIMKALGLVIDCSVSVRDLGAPLGPGGRLRAQLQWGPGFAAATDETPWTRFETDADGFRAQPKNGSDISRGLLTLANADLFNVFQTDVDGNALKTIDFATNMVAVLGKLLEIPAGENAPYEPLDKPAPEALPAQRNGGFTVARLNRDEKVVADMAAQSVINAALGTTDLYYDDVARGLRVDVQYNGRWRSLCMRNGRYTVADEIVTLPEPEEGYVKAASATSDPSAKPKPGNPMYLHEAIFGWENWSLVAPRPGRTISRKRNDDTKTQTVEIERVPNVPPPELPFVPELSVADGSLPRLRFGERYAFRARVVDLAGNSLAYRESDFPDVFWKSPELPYLRYEPVPPPVLVLREPVTAGESVEHLVVRSKVGTASIPDETQIFNDACRRFVAPPKTSQILAELHGEFDPFWSTPDVAYAIAAKEAGTLNDPLDDVKIYTYDGTETAFPDDYMRGDPLEKGTYTVHTKSVLALPYLPDPLALGLVFQGVPGTLAIRRDFDTSGGWPKYEPFELTLVKTSALDFAPAAPKFTEVGLPKGTMLTLRYGSFISIDGLRKMHRWHKLSGAMQSDVVDREHQHWMITPPRSVTFVHAVEKPLAKPTIAFMDVQRSAGQTFVSFARQSRFLCESHSTGQIDLLASWQDRVDRLEDLGPDWDDRGGRVFERKVGYEETMVEFFDGKPARPIPRHEFGDTKHRMVTYYPVGTTRYREYFPASITSDPELITEVGPAYEPTPTVTVVDVPSSARPDAPKLLYIVPTFKWVENANKTQRTRVGRGLRVYLDRPWYSSGEGELLGVVVAPGTGETAELRRFISQWGADPLYESDAPAAPIGLASFVSDPEAPGFAPIAGTNLRLAERGTQNLRVNIVGFKPDFDGVRGVHFVDLVLAPGAVFQPFVRLSLVRYQPSSVADLHLSRLVRADFAQLMADRTASFAYVGRSQLEITVSGLASRNSLGSGLPLPSPSPLPPIASSSAPLSSAADPALQISPNPGAIGNPNVDPGVIVDPTVIVKDIYAGAGRLVRVHFERLDNPASIDFGWTTLPGEWLLESYKSLLSAEFVIWKRAVPLPAGLGSDGKRYRVVMREFELFETDPALAESVPVLNPEGIPIRQRLVYVDRFELESGMGVSGSL